MAVGWAVRVWASGRPGRGEIGKSGLKTHPRVWGVLRGGGRLVQSGSNPTFLPGPAWCTSQRPRGLGGNPGPSILAWFLPACPSSSNF